MSDVAKKTLPPGSWPGSKGGPKTAETAPSEKDAAPRSVATPTLPKDGQSDAGTSDDFEASHYTHQKENLENIDEEDDDQQKSIKMTDEESSKVDGEERDEAVHEDLQSEQHIQDKDQPIDANEVQQDVEGTEEGAEQAVDESQAGTEEVEQATGKTEQTTSDKSQLTEQAKKAFDLASENQATSEAREAYLKSARESAAGSGQKSQQLSKAGGAVSQKSGQEGAAVEDQNLDKSQPDLQEMEPTEIQDQEQQEQEPTVSAKETATQNAPDISGQEGTATEAGEQATADVEGTAPTEIQGQTQDTLGGEGVDVQDTAAEGAKTIEESATVPEMLDFSVLKNGKVNKGGNVVDDEGKVVGRVTEGILMYLIGKRVDENGDIWSDNGKVIGKAEPITDSERDDMMKEPSPFESFPDAVVDGNGMVVSNGEWVGKVIEGDLKVLRGKSVDPDGDILDKGGNVIGKAERWEPEPEAEPEPEPEVDRSILAGKRVNKAGNVVDGAGVIFGRVVEGDVKNMVNRMCNKNGEILSESGDVLGRAEVVPEGEREGMKEGPFAELEGCTVAKDGTVVTPSGDIVGRLVSGDGKILFGRAVDEDGDVLDKNGNIIGKAERWEPEKVEHKKNPMEGRRVNREGNVVDEDGNIIGKLTSGDPTTCSGKEIDDDGDVVDHKGTVIGHCTLLEDLPQETESPEEKEKAERAEQDRKLAIQMSVCVEQCLDKIRPICKMITEKIDKAERTPEDERDEEALVREVRPLIEEGGRILTEAKGIIKGLDPDGRISANAKHKTAAREATPEEYHLADVLKDLTGDVTQCIENAKRKLEDMPHAKKELNPLWGLLNEPLFQILAAVGLLLSGVLGLVGRLLSGLGLGGLLDGLLGTLGINRVLEGLGVGSLTGGKKKKSGGGGGLLGGVLGG